MIDFLAFLLGLTLGALAVAVLPMTLNGPLFRLGDRIRDWFRFQR